MCMILNLNWHVHLYIYITCVCRDSYRLFLNGEGGGKCEYCQVVLSSGIDEKAKVWFSTEKCCIITKIMTKCQNFRGGTLVRKGNPRSPPLCESLVCSNNLYILDCHISTLINMCIAYIQLYSRWWHVHLSGIINYDERNPEHLRLIEYNWMHFLSINTLLILVLYKCKFPQLLFSTCIKGTNFFTSQSHRL